MPDLRMRPLLIGLCAMALPALAQTAQHEAAKRPEFEVASIKPASPANRAIAFNTYPGGKIIVTQCTLAFLVQEAFNVQPYQVVYGPHWIGEDRFDITAIPPASSASSHANPPSPRFPMNDEQRQMLQALLIERFGLRFHIEDRDGPVYLLTRGTRQLALTPPADTTVAPYFAIVIRPGDIVDGEAFGGNTPMSFVAVRLARYLERPVIDQTGITGAYDIKLPAVDPENTDILGGIVNCVERLGLKLKGARGPVHTIVIDAAAHPTEN